MKFACSLLAYFHALQYIHSFCWHCYRYYLLWSPHSIKFRIVIVIVIDIICYGHHSIKFRIVIVIVIDIICYGHHIVLNSEL